MRHVDAKKLSRGMMACALVVMPFAVGCGAKTDTVQDPLPPSAGQTTDGQAGYDQQPSTDLSAPTTLAPDSPQGPELSSPQVDGGDKPVAKASPEAVPGSDGPSDAERPRSLFRSIGRALGKGLTDATGAGSDASDGTIEPAEPAPTEPR